jgi:hypothetical protein
MFDISILDCPGDEPKSVPNSLKSIALQPEVGSMIWRIVFASEVIA